MDATTSLKARPQYKAPPPDLLGRLVPQLGSNVLERLLICSRLLTSRQDGAVRLTGGGKVKGQHKMDQRGEMLIADWLTESRLALWPR